MNLKQNLSWRGAGALVLVTLLLALATASAAAQSAGEPLKLTDQDAGKTVELKTGDTIEITLPGNATTGYSWGISGVDENVLKQVGTWDYTPSASTPGAPGDFVLTFQAIGAGTTDLALGYKQWWDAAMKPDKSFEITAVVTAPVKEANKKLTKADSGKTIVVNLGDRIDLALDCNPSTGYSWEITAINTSVLAQAGDAIFKASSDAVGAGGTCTFAFDAIATGASALHLGYKQWWDENMKADPTFAATVVVNVPTASTVAPGMTQGAPLEVNLTEEDAGKTISLAQGGTLTLRLPGNATTGYSWGVVSNNAAVLQVAGSWDYQTQSSAEGAPGTFIWTFKGETVGTSPLSLAYKRWWDDTATAEKTFEVTVSVESPITEDMPLLLGAPIQLDDGDNGSSIVLEKGQILTITLDCNRTTGYSWKIMRNNDRVLEHLGGGPQGGGDEPGAGGVCVHSYRALRNGSSDLKVGYKQWYNKGAKVERTFQVHVDVGLLQ